MNDANYEVPDGTDAPWAGPKNLLVFEVGFVDSTDVDNFTTYRTFHVFSTGFLHGPHWLTIVRPNNRSRAINLDAWSTEKKEDPVDINREPDDHQIISQEGIGNDPDMVKSSLQEIADTYIRLVEDGKDSDEINFYFNP